MNPIQSAIEHAGNASRLAAALGVTPQAIFFWRDAKRQIPADKCLAIEQATNGSVRCEELRPDVNWAYLRGTAPLADTATSPAQESAETVAACETAPAAAVEVARVPPAKLAVIERRIGRRGAAFSPQTHTDIDRRAEVEPTHLDRRIHNGGADVAKGV